MACDLVEKVVQKPTNILFQRVLLKQMPNAKFKYRSMIKYVEPSELKYKHCQYTVLLELNYSLPKTE